MTDKHQKQLAPADFAPTYPLDSDELQSLQDRLINQSPRFMIWHLLAQLGTRFALLNRFSESWSELQPQMSKAVVEHVVKQSNATQNYVIRSFISALENSKCDRASRLQAGDTLRKFLWLKQIIESALARNRSLSPQRANLEMLVDSVMHEICNEVLVLADLQARLSESLTSSEVSEIEALRSQICRSEERIALAYKTLQETEKQTTFGIQPSPANNNQSSEDSQVLDQLLETLREENELSQSINKRIENELPRD